MMVGGGGQVEVGGEPERNFSIFLSYGKVRVLPSTTLHRFCLCTVPAAATANYGRVDFGVTVRSLKAPGGGETVS